MKRRWPEFAAWLISLAVHLAALFWPGWEAPEPEGPAVRLLAKLQPQAAASGQPALKSKPKAKPKPRAKPVPEGKPTARLPQDKAEEAAEDDPQASAAQSGGVAQSEAVASDVSAPLAQASAPQADASSPSENPPAAERLARRGRVRYVGNASLLSATGILSWVHDGERYQAQLGAGLADDTSAFNYLSQGRLVGDQVQTETTQNEKRGKRSSGTIDAAAGLVRMQRGEDQRERPIAGLAVSLSSLPLALACLDEKIEKAELFVVGDFWVEEAVVINLGLETIALDGARVETRHYRSRIKNGKTFDIWLAPAWRMVPVRLRYDDGGLVVDLKAVDVSLDGETPYSRPERARER